MSSHGSINQTSETTALLTSQTTPFTIARQKKMTAEKVQECHRVVTKFLVKDLQPFATVESKWFRGKMVSRFLLLTALSCCVCGLELNMGHSSYQAEEKQNLTLDWTFTPKPHPSLKGLYVFCDMMKKRKVSALFDLQDGVEIPLRDGELSGRFQCDKDLLREGRIRLHVPSLRTEDSGQYWCGVKTDSGSGVDGCLLTVTAARNQTQSKTGPARNQTQSKTGPARNQIPSTTEPARNQTPSTT